MNLANQIERAIELVSRSKRIVALTGAGVSTPSGIPDFRSPGSGLWRNVDPMEVASIYSFRRRPEAFYKWIHPFARLTVEAKPNPAHIALAQMEKCGLLLGVITQNIDMLHSKAGSRNVYELHGHLREMTCLNCYTVFASDPFLESFIANQDIPSCSDCGGVLKPNLILYGEQLPVKVMNQATRLAKTADLMIVAGSSLETSPAGNLPFWASESGARLIIINIQPTPADYLADVVIRANVVDLLPRLVAPFLQR
jgi:NAD-dependent deacetylase